MGGLISLGAPAAPAIGLLMRTKACVFGLASARVVCIVSMSLYNLFSFFFLCLLRSRLGYD